MVGEVAMPMLSSCWTWRSEYECCLRRETWRLAGNARPEKINARPVYDGRQMGPLRESKARDVARGRDNPYILLTMKAPWIPIPTTSTLKNNRNSKLRATILDFPRRRNLSLP